MTIRPVLTSAGVVALAVSLALLVSACAGTPAVRRPTGHGPQSPPMGEWPSVPARWKGVFPQCAGTLDARPGCGKLKV